ncbi:MAG: S8 family serine peptidase, partial [Ilumatobacteraceae bacterium]
MAAVSALSATAGGAFVNAGGGATGDVAEWFDEVDPGMVVDQSSDCMAGATDAVFYDGNTIVLRSGISDAAARTAVNGALQGIYGGPSVSWATTVERITFPQPPAGPGIKPVLAVSLSPRSDGAPHPVVELARALRVEPGIESSPDYGLTPSTPYSFFWPNGHPRAISQLTPARTNLTPVGMPAGTAGMLPVGTGVTIGVYDVGLAPRAPGVLPNVSTLASADDELVDRNADGLADYPAVAHGLAIAGTIATLAPGAAVEEARVSARTGLATDVTAARRMANSLRNRPRQTWPALLVNAFGTATCDFDTSAPGQQLEPVGLKAVVEVTERFDPFLNDGILVVASAGNQDSARETYPAAFESVLAVGALDGTVDSDGSPWSALARTGPKADFSNYGDWVDAWTTGVALPTNHVTGVAFEKGLPILNGKAEVDGTSFAAPVVAAMIAEQMSITGLDARDAWDLIEAQGAD